MSVNTQASGLHPLFASILQAHGLANSAEHTFQLRRAAYVASLARMDWSFEYSDDHRVWTAGRDELKRLRVERAAVDADGAIWRASAAPDYKCEVPA